MLGYPAEASGLLVSGGSMANLVGLTVARNTHSGIDIRKHGVPRSAPDPLLLDRDAQFGAESGRTAGTRQRLDPLHPGQRALTRSIWTALESRYSRGSRGRAAPLVHRRQRRDDQHRSFDDLNRLADIAAREELWYHVDGAFGALAALAPDLRPLTAGMERADSLAFDLHKWFYAPHEVGCALVRNHDLHHHAFTLTPSYLAHGIAASPRASDWFSDYGFQLSRGFRALKVWMMIKTEGIDKYGRLIQQNVDQAHYLAELVDAAPELELLAPVALNVVCFRFRADGLDDEALNALNHELLIRLQESGAAIVTGTMLHGKQAIRMCNVNHRSRREDFDLLVREVIRIGKELVAKSVLNQ